MAYCTQTNVENRFASTKWWADANQDGTIDASLVSAHIAFAQGDVDRYVGQQYAVPLSLGNAATAGAIADVTVLLTGWKLAQRVADADAMNAMEAEYQEKIAWLRLVAKGEVKLAGETPTTETSPSGRPVIAGDTVVFTRDSMDGI